MGRAKTMAALGCALLCAGLALAAGKPHTRVAGDTPFVESGAFAPGSLETVGSPVVRPFSVHAPAAGGSVSAERAKSPIARSWRGGGTPPNDDCANAVAFDLAPGIPFTFSGDNTGATQDCPELGSPYGEVWFRFTTHETLTEIVVHYCGTAPAFENAYTVLSTTCPCSEEFVYASVFESESCGDGNLSVAWRGTLPAGTYYWPLLTDSTQSHAEGPYTVTFEAIGEIPGMPCPAETLYGQTPQRGAYASGETAGYVVFDNFNGMTQKIGGVEWWGLRLRAGASSWTACPSETPFEFKITLYGDNDGRPGSEVGSYVVTPAVTDATVYSYLSDMLHFSTGQLAPCYFLENGWISIESLPTPDGCVFLWMTSPEGDSIAFQDHLGVLSDAGTDMAFCLMPGDCPATYGACCDAYTGVCQWVEANDCLPPLQFTTGVQCVDLDPTCGTTGACCSPALECVFTGFEADCDAVAGRFFEGETCEDPEFECPAACDHRVLLRTGSSSGWYGNTLDVLVNGEVVLSQLTLLDGQSVSYYFQAKNGDTIETIYHEIVPDPRVECYEIYDGRDYWLGASGVDTTGSCVGRPTGITVFGNCDVLTTGACCHMDGGCEITTAEECVGDSEFLGVGTPCESCPPCLIPCPPDGIPEGQQNNGGCGVSPPAFEPIACGDTICGRIWSDYPFGWDEDWFELEPAAEYRLITWTFKTSVRTTIDIKRAGPDGDCNGAVSISHTSSRGCVESTLSLEAEAGETYWFCVGRVVTTYPCDVPYRMTLTCETLASGACCLPSGACINVTAAGCEAAFGAYQGDGTVCGDVACTPFYCAAGAVNCSGGEHIAHVVVGTIDNASDCGLDGYEDYTSLSTDLFIGTSESMSVDSGASWSSVCTAWIDYNHDLDFDDPGEETVAVYEGGLYHLEITPPIDALFGTTRMRIRVGAYFGGSGTCGQADFGEVEDYTVNITDGLGACCTPEGNCLTLSGAVGCIVDHQGAWFLGETCQNDGGSFVCPLGACCTATSECVTADRDTCEQQYDGTWHIGVTCQQDGGSFECPVPDFGACCDHVFSDCYTLAGPTAEFTCIDTLFGTWYPGETCVQDGGDFECPSIAGACCTGDGICQMADTEYACVVYVNGHWFPEEVCVGAGGDFECPPPGPGACCHQFGACETLDDPYECLMPYFETTWYPGETCAAEGGSVECPFNGGACCMGGGLSCITAGSEDDCVISLGGTWYPDERCLSDGGNLECPFTGGACCHDGMCFTVENEATCFMIFAGTYYPGEKCADSGGTFVCPGNGPCGDFTGDGLVDADDYWVFIAAFGRCVGDDEYNAACDFDGDNCITLADLQHWMYCYELANGGKQFVAPPQPKPQPAGRPLAPAAPGLKPADQSTSAPRARNR